jgi:CheY-like chemotaxis protein
MMSYPENRSLGTVLVISPDSIGSRQIGDALQEHALCVEANVDVPEALDRLSRHKFVAVIVDLAFGDRATACLREIRASPLNRTAVTFAMTSKSEDAAQALKHGFSFVLERPLMPDTISHTLKVAYGMIVRERRRYFRYPIVIPAVLKRKAGPEVYGRTINLSERGMALKTAIPLEPGSEGTAEFTLLDPSLRITAEYKVCWSNDRGEIGVSFVFMPSEIASELQAWLARKLEAELPQVVAEKFCHSSGQ